MDDELQQPIEDAATVIKNIADMKANMVPKAEYEKALADAEKFKHALLTGVNEPVSEPLKPTSELVKEYAEAIKGGVSNVKGFETTLKLRQAVINETGVDPFMHDGTCGGGSKIQNFDPDFGERVAEGLQNMINKSEGNANMFNALLSQNLR
jgi:hypothetical protein